MASVDVPLKRLRFGQTARKDNWWLMPLVTFVVFTSFVVYTTWALLQGESYYFGNYLSPFYSPELFSPPGKLSPHAWFGTWNWPWLPFIKYSPAMLILVFPLAFRMTCYYYRGAYYKERSGPIPSPAPSASRATTTAAKPSCRSSSRPASLRLYVALVFIALLSIDAWTGCGSPTRRRAARSSASASARSCSSRTSSASRGYTLGCHSLRHLVSGVLDTLSRARRLGKKPTTA